MNGVVRPQARPTRRKPRVQFRIEGEGAGGASVSREDIVGRERQGSRVGGDGDSLVPGSFRA